MQPERCEIWVEKDSIIGSIEELTDDLGLTVRVGRGFLSTTKAHDLAGLISASTKPMTVFYLGDHDPSGRFIETDLHDRIAAYGAEFEMVRLAIHASDIVDFALPPLRVKEKDPRSASFIEQYGDDCVELDALPPTELRERIQQNVTALMDLEAWDRAMKVEKVEIDSLEDFLSKWPSAT